MRKQQEPKTSGASLKDRDALQAMKMKNLPGLRISAGEVVWTGSLAEPCVRNVALTG
jgi:hypothetical protein